jgi:hypothetical protein
MVRWVPDFVVDGALYLYNWWTSTGGEAPDAGLIELTPSTPHREIKSQSGEVSTPLAK